LEDNMGDLTKAVVLTWVFSVVCASNAFAAGRGIAIKPDAEGKFTYEDDFKSPKVFRDAFLTNFPTETWSPGNIVNSGPNRNRTLTYRFYGDRVIEKIDINVKQAANGPNLGGQNTLHVSQNGLDWTVVADSRSQKADRNGWQTGPLTILTEQADKFVGRTELWVRIVLDNYSGLKTNTSNTISSLQVKLKVGDKAKAEDDPQAAERSEWGRLRRQARWWSITVDHADPIGQRPPHYYEDSDGWLQTPGANPHLVIDEADGFPAQRAYSGAKRLPISLVAFVRTGETKGPLMVRVVVRSSKGSSRKMNVLWDGQTLATFDVARYFDEDNVFFVKIPGPREAGLHELRIVGSDSGRILVRSIVLTGSPELQWADKPALPEGGRLEVLSAYYMPDPLPPAASQAVEGRHKVQEAGLVFKKLQRLYKEHSDFGAVRVVVRNTGSGPVRITEKLLLNDKPIEDSYVDFVKDPWDARGVVWYRVRPRLVVPGQCGQIYVRFRRRPGGTGADLRINLGNGESLKVTVPYKEPALTIDYATTDKSMTTLYVYARRSRGAKPGRVTGLALDGELLQNATIYGSDFPGNVALAVAKLPKPLKEGDYHVVGIVTDSNRRVDAQFRVLRFWFPRSSIHVPSQLCKPMHMNLGMWKQRSLDTCNKYDIYTTTMMSVFDLHERVAFILGPDEPDAHDNRGGGYDKGLGYQARRLAQTGWQELIERHAPGAASWIIMNGTTRPLNWGVYGQFADIACFDPYPVRFYGADHAYVRESLSHTRKCGAPNRMYACMEAFGWKKGQAARGPIPHEYRQNIVQAIGVGMKGLTSWVYSSGAGGWQGNKPCAEEITKMNRLIEQIEADLLLGTPIDLASSDAGMVPTGIVGQENWPKQRVWVGSLLCGPEAIVVAAANHISASKPNPPKIEAAKNVSVTVELPKYIGSIVAFEATEDGLTPYKCTIGNGRAVLKLERIESGRVFVLRRRSE